MFRGVNSSQVQNQNCSFSGNLQLCWRNRIHSGNVSKITELGSYGLSSLKIQHLEKIWSVCFYAFADSFRVDYVIVRGSESKNAHLKSCSFHGNLKICWRNRIHSGNVSKITELGSYGLSFLKIQHLEIFWSVCFYAFADSFRVDFIIVHGSESKNAQLESCSPHGGLKLCWRSQIHSGLESEVIKLGK